MTEKCRLLLALVSDCFGYVFIVSIHIPDRWQSKTLMLSTNVDQIRQKQTFWIAVCLPDWRQMVNSSDLRSTFIDCSEPSRLSPIRLSVSYDN